MMLVYLAGPITGKTYSEALDWRSAFGMSCTHAPRIITLSPMRGKTYLQDLGTKPISDSMHPMSENFLSQPKSIYSRDMFDLRRCDAVVVNLLGAKERSIGTLFEIGYARALGKIIITIMEEGNVHDHAFVREASNFIVPRLIDAENLLDQLV